MLRRLMVLVLLLASALLAATGPASAAWGVSGSGPARAEAVVVPRGATPTVSEYPDPSTGIPVYRITWTTSTLPGGRAASGYQVRRTVFPGTFMARTEVISGGTCLGATVDGLTNVYGPSSPTAAQQSCTDTEAFAKGDVTYSVTPVLSRWVGPTSAPSAIYR